MTPVSGPNLRLRMIEEADAAYVHTLRGDPTYNTHLSAVTGDVADQAAWIRAYKSREAAGQEYYFIIERHDGTRCGTVRLYDISADVFTWGSWILDNNKTPKAALESAMLVYITAFECLGLLNARFDVRRDNAITLAFHKRFGATQTHETEQDIHFMYPRERFNADRAGYMEILEGQRLA